MVSERGMPTGWSGFMNVCPGHADEGVSAACFPLAQAIPLRGTAAFRSGAATGPGNAAVRCGSAQRAGGRAEGCAQRLP
jgi:hypothetical protein